MRLSALLALASKVTLPRDYRYGMSRPGSLADRRKNPPGTRRRRVAVEPISDEEWHLFCGDTVRASDGQSGGWGAPGRDPLPDTHVFSQVEVLEGKDAGKQGKVVQVIRQRNWVVLEGLNTVSGERWGLSGSPSPLALCAESSPGREEASQGRDPADRSLFPWGSVPRASFPTALPLRGPDGGLPGHHDPQRSALAPQPGQARGPRGQASTRARGRGLPTLRVCTSVDHVDTKERGVAGSAVERGCPSGGREPPPVTPVQMEQRQDGDLFTLTF